MVKRKISYAVESLKAGHASVRTPKQSNDGKLLADADGQWRTIPIVAGGINKADKIISFPRDAQKKPGGINTRIIKADIVEEVRKLKITSGSDMTLMAAQHFDPLLNRFDRWIQISMDPVVISKGRPIFNGIRTKIEPEAPSTRII